MTKDIALGTFCRHDPAEHSGARVWRLVFPIVAIFASTLVGGARHAGNR